MTEIVKAEFMEDAVAGYGMTSIQGIPEVYAMTEEEQEEAADITAGFKLLQFDGSEGVYKDLDTEDTYKELTGAVLGPLPDGQALFPSTEERLEGEFPNTYLCRSFSVDQPPMLNPQLSAEQHEKLQQMGAGQNCNGCPLAQWVDDERPRCSKRSKLLFFPAELAEPVILEAGGTSIKHSRNVLRQLKKNRIGRRPAAFYAFATRLYSEKVSDPDDKTRKWYELRGEQGDLMPPDAFQGLRSIKADTLAELEAYSRKMVERREARGALPPKEQPALPPVTTATEAVPTGGGTNLTPDGQVLLPGGVSVAEEAFAGIGDEDIPF